VSESASERAREREAARWRERPQWREKRERVPGSEQKREAARAEYEAAEDR
jgi:hypothetical protein